MQSLFDLSSFESLEPRRLMHAGHDHTLTANEFAVNAAGPAYTTVEETIFDASRSFAGDPVARSSVDGVAGTTDDALYQTYLDGATFDFAQPVENGSYRVELHLADMTSAGAGERVFDVLAEGTEVLSNLDVASIAGTKTAYVRTISVEVTDGTLNLAFRADTGTAFVNAIHIWPGEDVVPPPSEPATFTTVKAIDDTYVRGGATANSNFGNSSLLDIKADSNATYARFGYLRFGLAPFIGKSITSVKLRLYAGSSQTVATIIPLAVKAAGNDWVESTVNYNNRPAITGNALGTLNVGPAKQWFEIDVTAHVAAAVAANQTSLSFSLSGTTNTAPFARVNSSEAATNQPELVVGATATGPVDPPPVDPPPVDPPPVDPVTVINAVDDASVRGGSTATTNFGNDPLLDIKSDGNATYTRFGYLRFNLTPFVGQTIPSVKLRLYGGSSQAGSATIPVAVKGSDDTWIESTVNYDNRPAITGGTFGTMNVGPTKKWLEVDVTTYVKAALAANQTSLSFSLSGASITSPYARFNSSEAASNKPELVIGTVVVEPPPPPPVQQPQPISWKTVASVGQKREEAVSFDVGGRLYVIGGYVNSSTFAATTRVDRYDPASNTWTRLKDAPTKLTHAGVAIDPQTGLVWLAGGFIGDFPDPQGTNVVWKYNPNNDTWTKGPNLPSARGAGGAGIVGRTLYFFGGSNASRSSDETETWALDLDDSNASWQDKQDLPKGRNHFGYATVNGKIYVIGGQVGLEGKAVNQNVVNMYDPETNQWSQVASLPRILSHFHSTTDVYKNRYILIAGGEQPHNTAIRDVYLFDTVTNDWSKLTSLPDDRRAASGAIIGDTYFVGTGYKRSDGFSSVFWSADLTKLLLA